MLAPQPQARGLLPQSLGMVLADPARIIADLAAHQFHSSSASRVTAGAAGFLTFTQQSARPPR